MRRIKLTIAYDGTDYSGWQVQPERLTIQGVLEEIFAGIEKRPVHVAGSGRTDAGVHALAQVAAVSLDNAIPVANLRKAVNRLLPDSIRLLSAEEAPADFHPRFDAIAKTYEYRIFRGEVCSPFERRYVHHHPYPLNQDTFLASAPLLEGEHDFSAFATMDDRDGSKVRRIFSSCAWQEGERLIYQVRGSGFLKHMVRNIVGTLIEAAKGNVTSAHIETMLQTGHPKTGQRAPASGLFLASVEYPGLPTVP